jgi:hypothetical protein
MFHILQNLLEYSQHSENITICRIVSKSDECHRRRSIKKFCLFDQDGRNLNLLFHRERKERFSIVYGCLNLILSILIYHLKISNIENCSSLWSINWRNPCSHYQYSSSSQWTFFERHLRVRCWKTFGND